MRHPHLFEISAWPWLERLSARERRRVTLENVPPGDWDAIAARGFRLVFLMGVWTRSEIGREIALADAGLLAEYQRALPDWTPADVVGSPYCVRSYVPDPRMGGWDGLDRARAELNRRGIGLVVDFVPNHTAFDHTWTTAHPERYVLGTESDAREVPDDFRRVGDAIIACARDPYFPPWRDVAQLNYFNPETRRAMAGELRTIAAHCDGVRCDMAMLVLDDVFDGTWRRVLRDRWPPPGEDPWPELIAGSPDLLFLAEVYWDLEWRLQQEGFHYTYDKRLLDRLQGSTPGEVRAHLRADPEFSARLARFVENHDEPRSAEVLADRLPAAATMVTTLPGMRFFFDGQLEGRRIRTPVQLGRWHDEPPNAAAAALYSRLLAAAVAPLFHHGDWKLLEAASAGDSTFGDLVAYRWRQGPALAVVVVNLGPGVSSGHVPIAPDLPGGQAFELADALNGATYRWKRQALDARGLFVRLGPGQAHVFSVRGA